jgi:hypothetical protein
MFNGKIAYLLKFHSTPSLLAIAISEFESATSSDRRHSSPLTSSDDPP